MRLRLVFCTILVLMHQGSECNTCCANGEIYDVQSFTCVPEETISRAVQNNFQSLAEDTTQKETSLLQSLTDTNLKPTCKNKAKENGRDVHITLYNGDIREHLTRAANYCMNSADKFIIQNRCGKHTVWFNGNHTWVLGSLDKDRDCGVKFRYCKASERPVSTEEFPKCCGYGYIYNSNFDCVKSSSDVLPLFSTERDTDEIILDPLIDVLPKFSIGVDQRFKSKNGDVINNFCIDVMESKSEGQTAYKQIVIYEKAKKQKLPASFDLTFLSLETIFMSITFLIHLLLPRFKNLPGRIILLYTSTYLVWDFIRIHLKVSASKTAFSCFLRLVAFPYLKWSKCWWLFLFTFELLLRIKGIGVSSKNIERKRLVVYCLIAWVFNALLVAAACIGQGIDFNDFRLVRDNAACNFLNRALNPIKAVYIIVVPCALSCILDTVLLVVVTKTIQQTTQSMSKEHDYQKRQQRKRYMLIVRLYALGLTKIINAIVDISALYLPKMETPRHVTLTVLSLLYAVAIFMIFCCKRSVLREICHVRGIQFTTTSSTSAFYTRKSRIDNGYSTSEKGPELLEVNENTKTDC